MTDDNLYDYNIDDEIELMTYRLVDGSYIMAEEIDLDDENNIFFIGDPLEIQRSFGGYRITTWGYPSDEPELIQLVGDKIIARTEACPELRKHYKKYASARAIIDGITDEEIKQQVRKHFDELDKLDQEETFGEDDNNEAEFEEELQPKVIKKSSLNHPRWDWSSFGK